MTPNLRIKADIPRWLHDWLLNRGFAEEISEEGAPSLGLRAHLPSEVDYVQGKGPRPSTQNPE